MVEHLHAEGDEVDDPLPLGVGDGPQFEVLDPVVEPIPISMMNHFVCQEWSTEVKSHYQSVFTDLGNSANETPKRSGHRDLVIAVTDMSVAGALSDRTIRLGIPCGEESLVMGGAKSFGLVRPFAVIKGTESSTNSQRLLGWRSSPQQPQVVAMAITPRLGVPVAIRRHTGGM